MHLVRALMDEVFGAENAMRIILFPDRGLGASGLAAICDYLLVRANPSVAKFPALRGKSTTVDYIGAYQWIELPDGERQTHA